MDRYEFAFDPTYAPFLRLAGIRPSRAEVRIDGDVFVARFGRWRVETRLANISSVSVAGPHRPIKAIGVRLSVADRGLTFGSNAERTVCIEFREPVTGIDPFGLVKHPNLSLSVAEPDTLAAELRGVATT